jgi:broad specificity phosphatase PhoE
MKTIYLIRHGETEYNSEHKLQGSVNTSLSEVGRQQAEDLAVRMKDVQLDQIYCSDLSRTRQTAEPLAKTKGISIIEVPELREISFGVWESVPFATIKEKYPQEIHDFFIFPKKFRLSGAELFLDAQKRGWEAVKKIIREQKDETSVAVFSHGGLLRTVFCALLHMDLNAMWKLNLYNTAVSCIYEQKPEEYYIKYINNIEKL